MYTLIVVWLLSSGSLVAEPWQNGFATKDECQAAAALYKGNSDRMVFVSGCSHEDIMHLYPVFKFTTVKGDE